MSAPSASCGPALVRRLQEKAARALPAEHVDGWWLRHSTSCAWWVAAVLPHADRVVADDGWAGLFGMATLPHARGKGAGRSVLAALADWAGAHGADRLYLQVDCDNLPALRLYEGAGFADLCWYHYRTAR
ncbi:MAG TPA: GNAT family N-acetyltransferase [Euzebyales bacterium]|nr:GNAT family N-acetyltransferase [Euzebyales bacterium]